MAQVVRPSFVLCAAAVLASLTSPAGARELADLIQDGASRQALALIESGADVNEAQGDGTTPLHWAVYHIDTELVALLLERGADPNVINAYGSSPLGEAAKVAELGLVETLLDAGADPDALNADGQTVLMLAARSGSTEIARLLLEHGADVNARETWRGQSALIWAADSRFPEIVDLLLEHGAEVEFRTEAFDWPSQITSEPRAQYRPVGGLTPLLYAARSGCTPCVSAILDAGADIDRPTPEGMTPLIIALDNGAFDTAKLLLERGANPHLWDWYGRTALYVAVDVANAGRGTRTDGGVFAEDAGNERPVTGFEIVEMLLAGGVNPNPQLNMHRPGRGGNIGRFSDPLLTTGCTPLLRAAISQDLPTMRLLIEHGALVDLPNVMGVTPLMVAAGLGGGRGGFGGGGFDSEARAIEIVEMLLAAGADINARVVERYDRTAMLGRNNNAMVEREGYSPLLAAISRGWGRVTEHLIANGVDVDVVDARGNSAIDVALGQTGGGETVASDEIATRLREILGNARAAE
ncbi:MAG TPA: ankyrin repeat domain-containing protein [Gammaproteobacteria bacterium]|nr:ankyrin repeat domain-containing protein [Gammaproteobacteria bacterium]